MSSHYKLIDPFKGTVKTERYQDISVNYLRHDFYTQVFFDARISPEKFESGVYRLMQFSDPALNNRIRDVTLRPVLYRQDNVYPSMDEIMLNTEDTFKSSLMINNSNAQGFFCIDVDFESEGSAIFGKSMVQLQLPELIGRISFRTSGEESYTHKIANGQVYDPEVYVDFYKKFGAKWGGTPTVPRLPNLIGLFPRNIGTSANPYSHYFNVNNPGDKHIQRIPKIKWMNHLVQNHRHATNVAWSGDCRCTGGSGGASSAYGPYTGNDTYSVYLPNLDWIGRIQTSATVNLSNYEFTNRFEPKCIEVIPFVRMI